MGRRIHYHPDLLFSCPKSPHVPTVSTDVAFPIDFQENPQNNLLFSARLSYRPHLPSLWLPFPGALDFPTSFTSSVNGPPAGTLGNEFFAFVSFEGMY